jgi:hypothetical protein
MKQDIEKTLCYIFEHCKAVQKGKVKPMTSEQAQEQVRLFLGLQRKPRRVKD